MIVEENGNTTKVAGTCDILLPSPVHLKYLTLIYIKVLVTFFPQIVYMWSV